MSRILNRPLFRRGGSATGITSGLDRPGYDPGGRVDYPAMYEQAEEITEKLYPARDSRRDWGRYLMDFGVEFASAEPKGSVFGTAASALKGPTQRFLAREDVDEKSRGQTKADIFSSMIDAEAKMLGSEAGGKLYKDQVMLQALQDAITTKYNLDKKGYDNLNDDELLAYKQAEVTINQLQKEDKLIQNVLGNTKVVDTLLKGILDAKSQEMITDPNNPGAQIKKYPNTTEGQQKMYQDAIVELRQVIMTAGQPKKKAEGGRIGYQDGSMVEDISMQETIEEPAMGVGEPQAEPADISYDELRARLPDSINDDIVMLLSQSAQALEDFAMIQTQQDVDNFNTKYNVNLVLPQEV
tara:strand:+ start:941 stop:2002 length:1062 start_codon:yes stop_codon:yes gene_type:complete